MKVFVDSPQPNVLQDPVLGFPFSHMEGVVPCSKRGDADFIFAPFETSYASLVNQMGRRVLKSRSFKRWGEKYVFFTVADNPAFAYEDARGLKFLASPIYAPDVNREMNVVHVPLWLGTPSWDIQKDKEFIAELRDTPKSRNFIFIGDMRKIGERDRGWLAKVCLMSYKLEHRDPCLWQPGFGESMRGFLREVARAKYCFAPRGIGTSSARLYEAMLAGTVPIVDNSLDMPLRREVECFRGAVQAPEKQRFPYRDLPLIGKPYRQKREEAMYYWDRYCYLPNCALEIQRQHLT